LTRSLQLTPAAGVVLRPSADRGRAEDASLAPASLVSLLKNPNTGREQTGTLSTTGAARTPAEWGRSIARERDRVDECALPTGELQPRSMPWNTIFPDAFIRGESTEAAPGGGVAERQRRAGLVTPRARAGLCAARVGAGEAAGGEVCGAWGWERTRRMRGRGVGSTESREWRGVGSTLSRERPEDDDAEEREKRDEARETEVSESELSRRSDGADEQSADARPPLRCRRSSLSDLAAVEVDARGGVSVAGDEGFCGACTFLRRSSSRHRLVHVGALGENTHGSSAAAGCSALTRSGAGDAVSTSDVSRRARSGAAGRSGSSFPSAKSSSAGSMVADPPRLNSKSKNSVEIAGSGFVTTGSSTDASEMRGGPSHPNDMVPAAAGPAGMLLATAEAMDGGEARPGAEGAGGTPEYGTWLVLRGDEREDRDDRTGVMPW
jgi:hypothetical protein